MKKQKQIKRTLSQPEAIEHICNMLNTTDGISRSELADEICEQFGFINPRGAKQRAGCLKALRELNFAGKIILPPPSRKPGTRKPRRLSEPVAPPQNVPAQVGEICELTLFRVETEEHMRIWNELMIQDHPRGAGLLVGRQIRYLIESEYGWLGGIAFSSAAFQLEDRDQWIGWDLETRRANLHYVVNMSRFLIRSDVSCRNLASKVLGMAIRQLPQDFENRYGYSPLLLESFVDKSQYTGTCYRAANWQLIGHTKGRGRQDRFNKKGETIKDIYVYPLENDFRLKMDIPEDRGVEAIEIENGIDGESWAENEFGGAPLGDKRLSRRLVEIANEKAENPGVSYSGAVGGAWPKVKAYYRFIDKPDDSAVTMENILLPHRQRTIQRMKAQQTVLCLQDGSDLNFSNLDKCEGLGVIGTNQTGAQSRGFHLHSTIAVTSEGLPLGILRSECTAPELKDKNDNRPSTAIPIEEKKTFCWIESVRDCINLQTLMPDTSIINVMDREGDFFEMFDDHRGNSENVDLIVRAKHDRKTTGEHKLFEAARQSPIKKRMNIKVPRQSARSKKSKQKAKPKRQARIAEVSVRYTQVEFNPPSYYRNKDPLTIWVVHAWEENPPTNTEPLEWFLLTTIDMKSVDDALQIIKWYSLRWRIEDWHRVLKSGCKTEKAANETAERLKRTIAINLVIAWRIMLMTLLGREVPELPAEVLFSDLEIEVLKAYAKIKNFTPPKNLGDAVKVVARIGGYLDRKKDPPPGHKLMWQGYTQLQLMCEGFALSSQR